MWNEKFDPMSFPEAIDKVLKRQFVFKIKVVPHCFCFFVMELCEDKELTALITNMWNCLLLIVLFVMRKRKRLVV